MPSNLNIFFVTTSVFIKGPQTRTKLEPMPLKCKEFWGGTSDSIFRFASLTDLDHMEFHYFRDFGIDSMFGSFWNPLYIYSMCIPLHRRVVNSGDRRLLPS